MFRWADTSVHGTTHICKPFFSSRNGRTMQGCNPRGGKGRACVPRPHLTAPLRWWRLLEVEPSPSCCTPGLGRGGGSQHGAVRRSAAAEGQCGAGGDRTGSAVARPSLWLLWPLSPLRPRRLPRLHTWGSGTARALCPCPDLSAAPLLGRKWRPLPAQPTARQGCTEGMWVWSAGWVGGWTGSFQRAFPALGILWFYSVSAFGTLLPGKSAM